MFPLRIPPKAALPPARENGVDCTAVPNTLAFAGALNEPKSETTFRCGDVLTRVGEVVVDDVNLDSGERGGK